MTDERFIELLNLYIDGELLPTEVGDLEEEILSNPERRQIYGEYCRIHRATRVYFESFSTTPESRSAYNIQVLQRAVRGQEAAQPPKTVAFPRQWVGWGTGLAAACLLAVAGFRYFMPAPSERSAPATPQVMRTPQPVVFAAPVTANLRGEPLGLREDMPTRDPFSLATVSEELAEEENRTGGGIFIQDFDISIRRAQNFDLGRFQIGPRPANPRARVFKSRQDINEMNLEPVGYRIHR